jgi:hypothetical protein
MIIDCDGCRVRGLACQDCVVAVLIGPPEERPDERPHERSGGATGTWLLPGRWPDLDADERRALGVLAQAGLVPPLRLATAQPPPDEDPHPGALDRPVTNDTPTFGRRAV